jgi:hypothetical protein
MLLMMIVDQLKCQPFIPINPRNQQEPKILSPSGLPICDAGLEMKSNGTWTEGLRIRLKSRCPIITDTKIAIKYPDGCPISHPKFTQGKGYGGTKYLDITNDARSKVPQDTYNLRTEVERYFARLGSREAEQTTHYKLRSVQNQVTIAHLSITLIAYAAALILKQPEKIRYYRNLADDSVLLKAA